MAIVCYVSPDTYPAVIPIWHNMAFMLERRFLVLPTSVMYVKPSLSINHKTTRLIIFEQSKGKNLAKKRPLLAISWKFIQCSVVHNLAELYGGVTRLVSEQTRRMSCFI